MPHLSGISTVHTPVAGLHRACPSTTLDKDVLLCSRNSNENCLFCQTLCCVGYDLKEPICFSSTSACSARFSTGSARGWVLFWPLVSGPLQRPLTRWRKAPSASVSFEPSWVWPRRVTGRVQPRVMRSGFQPKSEPWRKVSSIRVRPSA